MARRRNRYNRKRTRGRFSFLYKLLTFVVICGAISVALALFFKIETVHVTGNQRYEDGAILEASGIQIGGNLFLMNKFNAAESITNALPYVETVQIRRQIPTTLQIDVTECSTPAGIRQDGKVWLISGAGKIVDSLDMSAWSKYPQITGITLTDPVIGQPIVVDAEQESARDLLFSLLEQLEGKAMLADVQAIHLEDSSTLTMRYLNRFDVIFPSNADFSYKLDYLTAVVQRLEVNETGTIDMTQSDKASFIPA